MAEYISREEVLDIASQYCTDDDGSCSKADVDLREMLDEIEALPAADVKPVKYSSWEYRTYPIVDRDGVARRCMRGYVCKACGHGEPEEKRFCGGCGAEMRGDKK